MPSKILYRFMATCFYGALIMMVVQVVLWAAV
jgi:hypothetical protein